MIRHDRIDDGAVLPKRLRRAGLVGAHQPAVTGNISGQNRRQPAFDSALLPRSGHGGAL